MKTKEQYNYITDLYYRETRKGVEVVLTKNVHNINEKLKIKFEKVKYYELYKMFGIGLNRLWVREEQMKETPTLFVL